MPKDIIRAVGAFALLVMLTAGCALALEPAELRVLKEAGLDDDTLGLLVAHRSLETGQLTVDELVGLKRAGLGEAALRRFIEDGSFLRRPPERVYRSEGPLKRFLTVADLIELKKAGIGDATLQALVRGAPAEGGTDDEMDRAWRMLEAMGLIVDKRPATTSP